MLPTLVLPGSHARQRRAGSADPRSAFTLVEILVALAILGLLVAVAVNNLDKVFGNSQVKVAQLFVTTEMEAPLTAYRIDMGDYPSTEEGLMALYVAPGNKTDRWHGSYAKGNKPPQDPWGRDYHYVYPGTHNKGSYDLWSAGPDGVDGSEDDIKNW